MAVVIVGWLAAVTQAWIGEGFNDVRVVRPEGSKNLAEAAISIRREKLVEILVQSEEHRNDQRGQFPLPGMQPKCPADHLHDIDHRAARIREKDRVTFCGIDTFTQNANRRKHPQFSPHIPALKTRTSKKIRGELNEHLTAMRGGVLTVEPVRPHLISRRVGVGDVFGEPTRSDGHGGRHCFGLAHPAVERQHPTEPLLNSRPHQPGLHRRQPRPTHRIRTGVLTAHRGVQIRITDIETQHLIRRHDPASNRLRQRQLVRHRPKHRRPVLHRGDQPGAFTFGLPHPGSGRHVQPPLRRKLRLVVHGGPGLHAITAGPVRLINDHQAPHP